MIKNLNKHTQKPNNLEGSMKKSASLFRQSGIQGQMQQAPAIDPNVYENVSRADLIQLVQKQNPSSGTGSISYDDAKKMVDAELEKLPITKDEKTYEKDGNGNIVHLKEVKLKRATLRQLLVNIDTNQVTNDSITDKEAGNFFPWMYTGEEEKPLSIIPSDNDAPANNPFAPFQEFVQQFIKMFQQLFGDWFGGAGHLSESQEVLDLVEKQAETDLERAGVKPSDVEKTIKMSVDKAMEDPNQAKTLADRVSKTAEEQLRNDSKEVIKESLKGQQAYSDKITEFNTKSKNPTIPQEINIGGTKIKLFDKEGNPIDKDGFTWKKLDRNKDEYTKFDKNGNFVDKEGKFWRETTQGISGSYTQVDKDGKDVLSAPVAPATIGTPIIAPTVTTVKSELGKIKQAEITLPDPTMVPTPDNLKDKYTAAYQAQAQRLNTITFEQATAMAENMILHDFTIGMDAKEGYKGGVDEVTSKGKKLVYISRTNDVNGSILSSEKPTADAIGAVDVNSGMLYKFKKQQDGVTFETDSKGNKILDTDKPVVAVDAMGKNLEGSTGKFKNADILGQMTAKSLLNDLQEASYGTKSSAGGSKMYQVLVTDKMLVQREGSTLERTAAIQGATANQSADYGLNQLKNFLESTQKYLKTLNPPQDLSDIKLSKEVADAFKHNDSDLRSEYWSKVVGKFGEKNGNWAAVVFDDPRMQAIDITKENLGSKRDERTKEFYNGWIKEVSDNFRQSAIVEAVATGSSTPLEYVEREARKNKIEKNLDLDKELMALTVGNLEEILRKKEAGEALSAAENAAYQNLYRNVRSSLRAGNSDYNPGFNEIKDGMDVLVKHMQRNVLKDTKIIDSWEELEKFQDLSKVSDVKQPTKYDNEARKHYVNLIHVAQNPYNVQGANDWALQDAINNNTPEVREIYLKYKAVHFITDIARNQGTKALPENIQGVPIQDFAKEVFDLAVREPGFNEILYKHFSGSAWESTVGVNIREVGSEKSSAEKFAKTYEKAVTAEVTNANTLNLDGTIEKAQQSVQNADNETRIAEKLQEKISGNLNAKGKGFAGIKTVVQEFATEATGNDATKANEKEIVVQKVISNPDYKLTAEEQKLFDGSKLTIDQLKLLDLVIKESQDIVNVLKESGTVRKADYNKEVGELNDVIANLTGELAKDKINKDGTITGDYSQLDSAILAQVKKFKVEQDNLLKGVKPSNGR